MLSLPAIAEFTFYNVYCIINHDSEALHSNQLKFVIASTVLLGVLLIALIYSLVTMQIVYQKKGVQINHKMQILASVAMLLLLVV